MQKAADSFGIRSNLLYRWQQQLEDQKSCKTLSEDERADLKELHKEAGKLRMKKQKIGQRALCKGNEVKYRFISQQSTQFPVTALCQVIGVSSLPY